MNGERTLSKKAQFGLLSLIPLYFMVAGLLAQPIDEIGAGIVRIISEPDFLITDYFVIGGIGAAFINAGILALISIWMAYALKMDLSGHTITAACLMFGFSLFGKNLLNIWAILFGIFLYARYHRTSVSRYLYIGFYGTSLSPIITEIMQIGQLPLEGRLVLSLLAGSLIGFVLPSLATHVHYAHKGYSLYNVGLNKIAARWPAKAVA